MPDKGTTRKGIKDEPQRIKLTARLSLSAYNGITEIQRLHRTKTGRVLPLWKILDTAIIDYAKQQGIQSNE